MAQAMLVNGEGNRTEDAFAKGDAKGKVIAQTTIYSLAVMIEAAFLLGVVFSSDPAVRMASSIITAVISVMAVFLVYNGLNAATRVMQDRCFQLASEMGLSLTNSQVLEIARCRSVGLTAHYFVDSILTTHVLVAKRLYFAGSSEDAQETSIRFIEYLHFNPEQYRIELEEQIVEEGQQEQPAT